MPPRDLPPDRPLTAFGLDSLAAVELQQAIETELGVALPLDDLFEDATLERLADHLLEQRTGGEAPRPADAARTVRAPARKDDAAAQADEAAQAAGSTAALSPGQRALFYLDRLAGAGPAYILAGAARLSGALDAGALRRCLEALLGRHEALRSTVEGGPGEPSRRVREVPAGWFDERDATAWTVAELHRCVEEAAFRPFDLERGPLLRAAWFTTAPDEAVLVLSLHHFAADFWSLAILLRELAALHAAGDAAAAPPLPPVAVSYTQAVDRQLRLLAGQEGKVLWDFWERALAGPLPDLELPTDRPRPRVQSFAGAALRRELAPVPTQRLLALARAQRATLYTTLLAAFQALLLRHTGQSEVLIGSPTAGRAAADLAGVVGFFVNPVVLRGDLRGDPSFVELLARARRTAIDAFSHQQLPFPLLAERLTPARDPGRSPVFQAMLVLQSTRDETEQALAGFTLGVPGTRLALGELELESLGLAPRGAQFDLTLQAAEIGGVLHTCLQFNTDLFDAATAARLLGHFLSLLEAAAAHPDGPAAELPLFSAAERQQALVEAAGAPLAAEAACLHHLCAAQAAGIPDAVAVTAAAGSLTYRELWRRARAMAAHLRALGVGPEQRVGIALDRSAEMVVSLLAVLEAGGAYVPLDLSYPKAHLAYVIADSRMAVLVTRRPLAAALPAHGAQQLYLEDVPGPGDGPSPPPPADRPAVLPGNLAYVIYTSGSTGRPKGVAIEHRSAGAMVAWARRAFSAEELAGVLAATSICFDLSVFEIFVPLACGGRVLMAGNALELPDLPGADQVSLLNTVPSVLAELLATGPLPRSVGTVNLAGEALPRALVDRLAAMPGVLRVHNLYGPSEDTTYSTWARVVPPAAGAAGERRIPPIGRPVDGSSAYLVDRRLQPVPAGVPGEIALAGAGLARGYFGRPELTAERFLPDPFAGRPGERLYRTGDLARRLPDGDLEFLGRIDMQVKVRGFRIELEEVEAVLGSHPGLRAAAVAVRRGRSPAGPAGAAGSSGATGTAGATGAAGAAGATAGGGGDALLTAYVVPAASASASADPGPSPGELRRFMAERLPAFMVPGAFVTLAALPLTRSGKVDRRALPEPAAAPAAPAAPAAAPAADVADGYVPAETPVEHQLVDIWSEVLSVPRIGIHDNFFELGGHSFHAARVLARVQEAFGVRVPLRGLLEHPTVAGLTIAIAEEMLRQAGLETASEVLAEME